MKTPEQLAPCMSDGALGLAAPREDAADAPGAQAPRSEAASSQRWARLGRRLDLLLAGSVLLLAFLASSFVARNSDFWLHLAGGKLLAQRRSPEGVDLLAYTTQQIQGPHPAWLLDLLLYGLYGWIGGVGLVLLKALLITALAWLLLRVRRPPPLSPPKMGGDKGGVWLPAVCTTLAVLAMSPQLLLRPTCLSYFFLGLTFWLLWRPHASGEQDRPASWNKRRYTCLLLLLVLWVNLDSWFLLGPLLAGLFWIGERLGSSQHTPTWLLPAALAVCLFNPHYWHAFSLPAELSLVPIAWQRSLRQLGSLLLGEINLAAWACLVLTVLGLLSFVLNWRHVRGWRLLTWGGFGLLSAWQVSAIPFFAVIAAPITVLNLQDYLERRSTAAKSLAGAAGWSVLGKAALLAGNVLLLLLAWPGWLQGFHSDARRVGWEVQPDPSLQRLAGTVRRWRQQGRLGDGERGLVFQPALTHYCAWFCPEEKCVFDQRFPHDLASGSQRWQQAFREGGIAYLALDDPNAFTRLVQDPRHWILLHLEGRAAIFGWRDEEGGTHPRAVPPLDVNRLAFAAEKKDDELLLPPAPAQGPGQEPEPRSLWARFSKPAPALALESETASLYLQYFRAGVWPQYRQHWIGCWAAYAAGLTGLPLFGAAASPIASVPLLLRLHQPSLFLGDIDQDLPAVPLLVVRLARRALALNPEDAAAYLHLGQAYRALYELAGERLPNNPLTLLAELRFVQIATALQHALILDPDLETAHRLLANLYSEHGYLDVALYHRREELRLARRVGIQDREDVSELPRRLQQLEQQVADLEKTVHNGQRTWAIAARTRTTTDPLTEAEETFRLGLAQTALDEILLPAPEVLLGSKGVRLELLLAVQLGGAEQIRSRLLAPKNREHKRNLGHLDIYAPPFPGYAPVYHLPAYDWLVLITAAACGDYELAEGQLREITEQVRIQHSQGLELVQRGLPLALAGEVGLGAAPQLPLARLLRRAQREEGTQLLLLTHFLEKEQADLNVLGGILALEQGQPQRAKDYLTMALQQRQAGARAAVAFASRAFAETYLRQIQKAARR